MTFSLQADALLGRARSVVFLPAMLKLKKKAQDPYHIKKVATLPISIWLKLSLPSKMPQGLSEGRTTVGGPVPGRFNGMKGR